MRRIVGIIGTTSVGKSAVGVELAKLIGGEVVSADSMQVYKGMDIGTAKMNAVEMQGIPHHMLDVVDPTENYSAYLYQEQASKVIDKINGIPIVVGGTGLYFDSLLYPPEFGGVDEKRRAELKGLYDEQGLDPLRDMLKRLDIDAYNQIDLNNPKRVLRAVEIAESGDKRSLARGRTFEPRYDLKLFVLERPRDSLYNKIDARVDEMISMGLVDEVRSLIAKCGHCGTTAFQAIGYKEIIEFLNGHVTLDDAIAKIKLNTRHYAKRQITYFKKMNVAERINVEGLSAKSIAEHIAKVLIDN